MAVDASEEGPRAANYLAVGAKQAGGACSPLLLAVVAIEITDVVFAIDSVPAVLAITHDTFMVYTSNIFAILGLRSLYFVLQSLLHRLHLLHYGLAADPGLRRRKDDRRGWFEMPTLWSLAIILGTVAIFSAASLLMPPRQPQH